MFNNNYAIVLLQKNELLPLDLLLMADETEAAVRKYIFQSEVYLVTDKISHEKIAVFVLFKIDNTKLEIKNIAITEKLRGKGIGSWLISNIKQIATQQNYKSLIVGTPDCAIQQINFYQKAGFIPFALKENFFINNYEEPIYENGILLKDMLMLKMTL
ncbi:GNAT family N-acetyltransferase [Pedobacter montanisoli]|uniref:GNAT family N-acetyltransferase n=1 Tax=Pedobacter montanisoli TaxID=2923277 RepID=A0ABS9ZU09_9SPHI|nr:GNAT family N-acetyltransferase [Pedobacter montanisoli]MCJ0742095.1 GNAT family N-acetyltransferase [Pedobacter montanisoli]